MKFRRFSLGALFVAIHVCGWMVFWETEESQAESEANKGSVGDSRESLGVLAEIELLLWDSIKDSDNPDMFDEYLLKFPEGYFSGVARIRRDELRGSQDADIRPAEPGLADVRDGDIEDWIERDYWLDAEVSGTPRAYHSYIERYPNGACVSLARVRVVEAEAWEKIKKIANPTVVETFIETHPNSPFALLAIEYLSLIMSKTSPSQIHVGGVSLLNLNLGEISKCNPVLKINIPSSQEDPITGPKESSTVVETKKERMIRAKRTCLDLGLIEKTEDFGACVIKRFDAE